MPYHYVFVYLDDILNYSQSMDEHIVHVLRVLQLLYSVYDLYSSLLGLRSKGVRTRLAKVSNPGPRFSSRF